VNEVAGAGLSGELAGRRVVLGSLAYVSSQLPSLSPWAQSLQARLDMEGASVVYVACDGVLLGALELADRLRLETPRALRMLKRCGVSHITMLSGDRQDVAEAIGHGIGVDQVFAGLQPQDKLAHIHQARARGVTLMVGDGVNDALPCARRMWAWRWARKVLQPPLKVPAWCCSTTGWTAWPKR
jgi:cation transport ATPase